jgi:hypothetical protein
MACPLMHSIGLPFLAKLISQMAHSHKMRSSGLDCQTQEMLWLEVEMGAQ